MSEAIREDLEIGYKETFRVFSKESDRNRIFRIVKIVRNTPKNIIRDLDPTSIYLPFILYIYILCHS